MPLLYVNRYDGKPMFFKSLDDNIEGQIMGNGSLQKKQLVTKYDRFIHHSPQTKEFFLIKI